MYIKPEGQSVPSATTDQGSGSCTSARLRRYALQCGRPNFQIQLLKRVPIFFIGPHEIDGKTEANLLFFSCYELHSIFLFNDFPVTWPKNVKICTKSSEEKAEKIVVFSYLQVPNSAVFTPSVTLPINVNF